MKTNPRPPRSTTSTNEPSKNAEIENIPKIVATTKIPEALPFVDGI